MKFFLIDGNSFCYRAFYAIKELRSSRGEATNAVYGFISMLRKIIKAEKPDYLGVVFDVKGPTFRHKKYDEYKIHRKPMPDELRAQMPVIKEVLTAYKIAVLEKEGYEADDILATIARKFASKKLNIFIVTGDKDALQLVNDNIKIYSTHKEGLIYTKELVKKRYGVNPESIVDLLALMGDASDNISGIPGFGEKTAVGLLKEHGSLHSIITNPDKIKQESKRKLVIEHADKAILSRELALLDDKVSIDIKLEDFKLGEPDSIKLHDIFKRLEFKNLIKEYAPQKLLDSTYTLISKKSQFKDFLSKLGESSMVAFDFETTSPDPMKARPIGISFCFIKGAASYVALKKIPASLVDRNEGELDMDYVFGNLRPFFEDERIKKIGQNIKYEYIILHNLGIRLKGIHFDTMLASYLLNPSKLNHNLDDISMEYLNYKMIPIEQLIGKGKNRITMDEVEIKKVSDYSSEDSDVTFRLKEILEKGLKDKGLYDLFKEVEMPLVEVLSKMEIEGIALDKKILKSMSHDLDNRLEALSQEIYSIAEGHFNINSHQQLSLVLFEKLKLPVIKKTKTGFSTDESVLKRLQGASPIIDLILEYRTLSKLKSTYVDALPGMVNKKTGRLHTSFNQTVTATGRLSSSDPNLQNIPIKTVVGREIRKAFIASGKDNILLSADYSQIELRILAHFSRDEKLVEAFTRGLDIHTYTAQLVFGVKEKEVTKRMRIQAKTVNFSVVYGISPYGLSRDLGIDVTLAANFIENYFNRYPKIKDYLDSQVETARKNGYVTTILQRRRYLPEINSTNNNIRQFAERQAINTPIQGSAADLIKMAMLNIEKEFISNDIKSSMILQVHDELVFDVLNSEIKKVEKIVKEKMENVFTLSIPLIANVGKGKNWFETGE